MTKIWSAGELLTAATLNANFAEINSDTHTFAGNKTFSGNLTVAGILAVDTDTLYVDAATNRVGIGTSSPGHRLVVTETDSAATRAINATINNTVAGTKYGMVLDCIGASTTNVGLIIAATGATNNHGLIVNPGNVGIGTSDPLQDLHISALGDTGIFLQTTNANTDKEIWQVGVGANASSEADLIFRTRTNAGTGGSEYMRIQNSSGNVGIGTASPTAILHTSQDKDSVSVIKFENLSATPGDTAAEVNLQLVLGDNGTAKGGVRLNAGKIGDFTNPNLCDAYFSIDVLENNNYNNDVFYINHLGNVGIGTSSPGAKLEIENTTANSSGLTNLIVLHTASGVGGSGSGIKFTTSTDKTYGPVIAGMRSSGGAIGDLVFNTIGSSTPTEAMRIDYLGNVGIGTSSPSVKLHILDIEGVGLPTIGASTKLIVDNTAGVSAMSILAGAGGSSILNFGDTNDENPGIISYNHVNDAFTFTTNTSPQMTINGAGNVGIGTDDPVSTVNVSATCLQIGGGVVDAVTLKLQDNENIWELYVNNNIGIFDGSTERMRISSSTGDLYTNDGSVSSLSDKRTKRDIEDLADGIDSLAKLRPVTFKYNGKSSLAHDDGITRFGLIADEVLEVLPHYVEVGEGDIDGKKVDDYKTLALGRMFPMAIKAIQEQQEQIEELKAQVAGLLAA